MASFWSITILSIFLCWLKSPWRNWPWLEILASRVALTALSLLSMSSVAISLLFLVINVRNCWSERTLARMRLARNRSLDLRSS
jgi:hypothetical protein